MDLGLKGQRVLVTGGTKSIGRAIVVGFVAEGATAGLCSLIVDGAITAHVQD